MILFLTFGNRTLMKNDLPTLTYKFPDRTAYRLYRLRFGIIMAY